MKRANRLNLPGVFRRDLLRYENEWTRPNNERHAEQIAKINAAKRQMDRRTAGKPRSVAKIVQRAIENWLGDEWAKLIRYLVHAYNVRSRWHTGNTLLLPADTRLVEIVVSVTAQFIAEKRK